MARPDPAAHALVLAALELHKRQLWREVPGNALFLLRVPGQEHPLVGCIMGQAGEEFGLSLTRGEQAFEAMRGLFESGGDEAALADVTTLGVTVAPLGEVEQELRGLAQAAGLQARREALVPMAVCRVPGRRARPANRSEQRLLASCVRAVLAAHDAGTFRPTELDGRRKRILEIAVADDAALIPDTRVQFVPWPGRQAQGRPSKTPAVPNLRVPWPQVEGPAVAVPDTLAGWKALDRSVTERIVQVFLDHLDTDRLQREYFGSADLARDVFTKCEGLVPQAGLVEWAMADWRITPGAKTLIEDWLEHPALPAADRALLECRRDARLSIYRIDSSRPNDSMDIEDVLSGERTTVHDSGLSSSGLDGFFMPLRVWRVGRWFFACVDGPPLPAALMDQALAQLEELGADLSPGALRRTAHLTGRIWEFAVPGRIPPPIVTNTDGELLELHTATFRVADEAALRAALARRKDIEGEDGDWNWLRPGGAGGIGTHTTLARLQLLDDRLVVEVNSARRAARARKWIERIPGLRFEQATVRAFDADAPLDDTLPDEPDPPLSREAQELLRQVADNHLRRWPDLPIPVLDHQTPREACRTAAGRRHVARLIRTMPPSMLEGTSILRPREWLLRELGIDEEGGGRPSSGR